MKPISIVLLSLAISLFVSASMCLWIETRIIKRYIILLLSSDLILFEKVKMITDEMQESKSCKYTKENQEYKKGYK